MIIQVKKFYMLLFMAYFSRIYVKKIEIVFYLIKEGIHFITCPLCAARKLLATKKRQCVPQRPKRKGDYANFHNLYEFKSYDY